MGREWTPKEFDDMYIQFPEHRKDLFSKFVTFGGKEVERYSNEEKEIFKKFPHLAICGLTFLILCERLKITYSVKGIELIEQIEKVVNNEEIENKNFEHKIKLWYEGKLRPGYYMRDNDMALIEEIKKLENEDDNNHQITVDN